MFTYIPYTQSIFSSAIVFGNPKWEVVGDAPSKVPPGTTTTTTTTTTEAPAIANIEGESPEEEEDRNVDTPTSSFDILHYGGSERTIDGTSKGAKRAPPKEGPVPIWTNQRSSGNTVANKSIFGFPGLDDNAILNTSGPKPAAATGLNNSKRKSTPSIRSKKKDDDDDDIDILDDDHDDDEDNEFVDGSDSDDSFKMSFPGKSGTSNTASATKTRVPPRRQASLNRKRYVAAESSEDDEDDEDDNSNSSEGDSNGEKDVKPPVKPPPSKRKATTGSKAAATSKTKISTKRKIATDHDENETEPNKTSKGSKPRARRSTAVAKQQVVDLLDSSNSDSDNGVKKSATKTSSGWKARARASSSAPDPDLSSESSCSSNSSSSSSSESDYNELMKGTVERPPTKKPTSSVPRKSTNGKNGKNANVKKGASRSAKKPDIGLLDSNDNDSTASTEKIGNKSPSRKRKGSVVVTLNRKKPAHGHVNGSASTPLSSSSPAGALSPFRRRRKSPAGKTPNSLLKASMVLDLTKDDEFHFG
jgi:hypothetical protein